MRHQASSGSRHEERSCLERRLEAADKLLQETVECHSRHYPTHSMGAAARDSLAELRPHLEDALRALADIERRRELSDQEHSWQRAFRLVLVTRK